MNKQKIISLGNCGLAAILVSIFARLQTGVSNGQESIPQDSRALARAKSGQLTAELEDS